MKKPLSLIPMESLERRIYLIRNTKVMLDEDLAEIYGVSTKRLNQQVQRNKDRFPVDFMLLLTAEENSQLKSLRLQSATLKNGRGAHRKYLPHVFNEGGRTRR